MIALPLLRQRPRAPIPSRSNSVRSSESQNVDSPQHGLSVPKAHLSPRLLQDSGNSENF